jgi:outer membrane protein OmpA-like peptidoglycan-associated protein
MRQQNRLARSVLASGLVVAGALCAAAPATAQESRRAMDANFFRPAMDSHGIFVVDRAEVGQPWSWGFRLTVNGAQGPIHLGLSGINGGASTTPVDYAINFHLGFHVTFTKWLALAIDVPFARQGLGLAYDGDETGGFVYNDPASNLGKEPQPVTAGDPRLSLKFRLFGTQGFALALAAMVTFPFGDEATFNGDRSFTVEPRIIASYTRGRFSVAANLGYLYRERARVYDPAVSGDAVLIELDDELTWGVGATVRLAKFMGLGVELYGRGPLLSDKADLPLEGLVGLIFNFGRITWAVGGGVGIGSFLEHHSLKPFGRAPTWRMFTTFAFVPSLTRTGGAVKDTDGDGIPDDKDQCPTEPEDKDGFEDDDGCPDPDNDQDGIPDVKDKCPNAPEDRDGFQDDDGCPELDNDGDGIPDSQDRCPNEPEDKDGYKDDDGCPDPDNDGDGIPDKVDKCPNEPEDFNGVDDGDGCPEGGAGTSIRGGKIDLKGQRIQFKSGSAVLIPASFKILDRIANMLRNNPRVKLVRIEGHTDDTGRTATNQQLSQSRAASVRDYLVKRGVARNRLTAVGYGETRPKVPNTNRKNRAINRRVEFIIVHQTR